MDLFLCTNRVSQDGTWLLRAENILGVRSEGFKKLERTNDVIYGWSLFKLLLVFANFPTSVEDLTLIDIWGLD